MQIPLRERTLSRMLSDKAKANGDRTFLLFEGQTYSYTQAYDISSQIAGGLIAAGIKPKQHVAIMMENRPETVWLNFAIALVGAVSVPVNNAARGDLLSYYVRQSDAVAIFLDAAFAERFSAVHTDCHLLDLVCVFQEDSNLFKNWNALFEKKVVLWEQIAACSALPTNASPAAFNDTLHILYSSGTTGAAKGSMVANATALMAASKYVELNGYSSNDVMFTCLPLFHGNAWNCTLLPALIADATVALSRRFSARNFWREIAQSGATHTSLLSAMINILWIQDPSPQEREHKLKVCLAVPAPEQPEEFERRFNVTLASIYSLSDFGLATVLPPGDRRDKLKSAGRPLPEVAVSILDEDDQPVPIGEVGEICLRNKEAWFSRQGYYKKSELYLSATRNLWFHTGDRGLLDEDGYLYFAGRSKEMIRRRGENISAISVEEVIRQHPAIADAAVYAVRAEFLEDEVMASIVLRSSHLLDPAELVHFCASRMAYFMVPRFIDFLTDLPVTPTGKVEKYKLQEEAQCRIADIWDRDKSGIILEK